MDASKNQHEAEVIRWARHGDEDALGTLVDSHADALISYIDRIVNDRFEAEDIAQETFIRAFDHLNKFETDRPFRPWIFKIGRNLALNYLASRAGHERRESENIDDHPIPAKIDGPEESLATVERRRGIETVLALLPPHFREVLHLRYMEGLEYDAIAGALDLPVGTVKTWLFRAKKDFLAKAQTSGLEF